jgi:hypothetical protein
MGLPVAYQQALKGRPVFTMVFKLLERPASLGVDPVLFFCYS